MRYQAFSVKKHEMNKGLWIGVGVVGGVLLITLLIVGIVIIVKRWRRKKKNYHTLSDDGKLKSSRSDPILLLKEPSLKDNIIRSRSTGHSPASSTNEFSSQFYPQPALSDDSLEHEDSRRSSILMMTDQYSPFQRSFHVETFPYLEFSTKQTDDAFSIVIVSLCNIPDNVRAAADSPAGGFFVKAYLMPDEICKQTKVYRPTGEESQVCNECLVFENIRNNTGLLLSAYFIDQRHIRMSLGHTTVPLELEDKMYRTRLEQLSQALHSNIGELELSITFFPDKSRLKVDIHRCKDLTLTDVKPTSVLMANHHSDNKHYMLIRVEFLHGRKISNEKDVTIAKLERNPQINESCSFPLTQKRADIAHLTILLIELISGDSEPTERCIGRVDIGPYLYARGEGLLHWQSILNKPKIPICMSHFFEIPVFD